LVATVNQCADIYELLLPANADPKNTYCANATVIRVLTVGAVHHAAHLSLDHWNTNTSKLAANIYVNPLAAPTLNARAQSDTAKNTMGTLIIELGIKLSNITCLANFLPINLTVRSLARYTRGDVNVLQVITIPAAFNL